MTSARLLILSWLSTLCVACADASEPTGARGDAGAAPGEQGDAAAPPAEDPDAQSDAGAAPDPQDGGSLPATGLPALDDFVGTADAAECVQAAHFLGSLRPDPANAEFADPFLDVTCSATQVAVRSNNIPSFEFVQQTPNALIEMDMTYRFPRFPVKASAPSEVPLGGVVAVAVNGLAVFGPTEAPAMGYRDPYLDGLLDFCNGHTAPNGMYHFHARPDCLFEDSEGNVRLVVAYAFDGFPILAPYACTSDGECVNAKKLASSYQRVASRWSGDTPDYAGTTRGSWDVHAYVEGSGDLDECNGLELPGGGYAYYASDTFPYFIGCYRGTPTANGGH